LLGTNKTLSAANESLENEVAVLRQKLGMLDVDKETNEARLRDLNAILTSKNNQLASFENVEVELKEDLNQARNEITRLTGTEKLLNDRIAALKTEEELNDNRIRELETDADAKIAEVDSLRELNSDLKFEVARKNEQIQSLAISNDELMAKIDEIGEKNEKLRLTESAMKGELSALRSELTSLGIEESRISEHKVRWSEKA